MRQGRPRHGLGRAIIAVVALYALTLQAFLAHAAPLGQHAIPGWLCAASSGSDGPERPLQSHHQCCTTVHVDGTVAPTALVTTIRFDRPVAATVVWRAEADIASTGPPVRSHGARAPPSA